MIEQNDKERIERFFSCGLSPAEAEELLEEIKVRPDLSEAFRGRQKVQSVIETFLAQDLKKKLSGNIAGTDGSLSTESKVRKLHVVYRYLVAASFIGVIAFVAINRTRYYNDANVFSRSYSLDFESTRSAGNHINDVEMAQMFLSSGQSDYYAESIRKLESIPADDSLYYKAQYLLGHLYLNTDNPEKAIVKFSGVADHQHDLSQDAQWYLALAYLKAGKAEETRGQIQKILNNKDHVHYQNAMDLDRSLNSIWRKV